MSTIDLLGAEGKKAGTVDLPDELFDATTNVALIHQVVTAQLAAARQGTHATKTRGEVSGGGKKPWRQKGTGRARQGSRRAPQWVGGGTVHGPQPRSYKQHTPKQMVHAALLGTLSDRARDGRIVVLDAIVTGDDPSTKQAAAVITALGDYTNVLVVLDRDDFVNWLSLRNLPQVHLLSADQLNAYDVVVSDVIVFTKKAIEVFAAAKGATVAIAVDEAKPAKKAAAKAKAEVVDDEPEAAVADAETEAEAEAEPKPVKKAAAKKPAKAETADEEDAK